MFVNVKDLASKESKKRKNFTQHQNQQNSSIWNCFVDSLLRYLNILALSNRFNSRVEENFSNFEREQVKISERSYRNARKFSSVCSQNLRNFTEKFGFCFM